MAAAKKKKKNSIPAEAVPENAAATAVPEIKSEAYNAEVKPEAEAEKGNAAAGNEAASKEKTVSEEKTELPSENKSEENVPAEKVEDDNTVETPEDNKTVEKPQGNNPVEKNESPVAPEQGKRIIKTSAQYSKSAEREKNIRKQVKKRKRRPVLLVLFLCSMLVLVAIVYNSLTREPELADQTGETAPAIETPPPAQIIVPTPTPSLEEAEEAGENQEAVEETAEPVAETTPEPVVEHSYQFFAEDISWEAARQRCQELGGYLAVISSYEELEQIITMAENYGVTHVWLGCHRVDGELIWEHEGEYYYQWDSGEPSAYDYNDNVAEDYLMFWQHNGYWYYNDSRNDPCADYPAYYSGDMGFVCEFGSN